MECKCSKCGMSIKGLTCNQCNIDLVADAAISKSTDEIQVAKCPMALGKLNLLSVAARTYLVPMNKKEK